MPVKRRDGKRREELPAGAEKWLSGGSGGSWVYLTSADELAALWRDHGGEIVAEHVQNQPGTRPQRWWQFDAPGPRQRCGGIGTPLHEFTAYGLVLVLGVPQMWLTAELALHGFLHPITDWPAIDRANPPLFESQSCFLDRFGLLLPGERRRLKPADFRPEPVTDILDLELRE